MTEHFFITMDTASDYDRDVYGITHKSSHVYRTSKNNGPTRIVVWDNTKRPNPHPGVLKWSAFGAVGGDGKYLDPHNHGTDSEISVLFSPECSVLDAYGTGTGSQGSGQVYGAEEKIKEGDQLTLVFLTGASAVLQAHFTSSYGHGEALEVH